jgi:hypothetical protein
MAREVPGHSIRQMLNSFAAAGIDVDEAIAGLGFRRSIKSGRSCETIWNRTPQTLSMCSRRM